LIIGNGNGGEGYTVKVSEAQRRGLPQQLGHQLQETSAGAPTLATQV
jgi:hypothetical protein